MATTRVAVLDDYQHAAEEFADWKSLDAEVAFFSDHLTDEDALVERLEPFEVIVAMRERTAFRAPLLARLDRLKLLVTTGMVNASIDVDAALERGVVVCGTPSGPRSTAELTWGLILSVARHIPTEDALVRSGGWQMSVGTVLEGRTLGVVGLGKLGSRVATIGLAFGMDVIAWSENLTSERAASLGARRVEKEDLFSLSDVVTVHLLLSHRTRGLIGAKELGLMKPHAIFVNTSRGPIVDEQALLDTLQRGAIGGAGLDVYDEEPLPLDHPLRNAPNTVLTPHLGYVTDASYRDYYRGAVEDIAAFLSGSMLRPVEPHHR